MKSMNGDLRGLEVEWGMMRSEMVSKSYAISFIMSPAAT